MHMADALLSPAVGGAMWAVSAAGLAHSARRLRKHEATRGERAGAGSRTALMGIMGAFVFAAQMLNFSIPGTGSSGHIAGGLLLGIMLGPEAAFLVIASVLIVQALFFADGGLLALGCNLFNMGFLGCYIGYPLIYKPLAGANPTRRRIFLAAIAAAAISLQLGAAAVVLETTLSGISALPIATFAMLMLPIHLAIGIVEGLITGAVVAFIAEARPELLQPSASSGVRGAGRRLTQLAVAAALTAGVLSWFASRNPDGLEWAIRRATGSTELAAPADGVHAELAQLQASAPMPDYAFRGVEKAGGSMQPETSVAGLLGAGLTLAMAGGIGLALRRRPAA